MDYQAIIRDLTYEALSVICYARKFSAEDRKRLIQEHKALPNGSFPIENTGDLKNAIQAFGRSHPNARSAVKAHIKKMAKKLDAEDLLPADWTEDGEGNGD